MPLTFPNESPEYRAARQRLLASEVALRRQMEAVATELRALPPGGEVPEDYVHAVPIMTVFRRDASGVMRLHWASELVAEPADLGQDMRHMGTVEPLWTLFDLTPRGRPASDEQFQYACCKE